MPQPPIEQPQVEHIRHVQQGMNDSDEVHLLPEGMAAYIENLEIEKAGARRRRNGVVDIGGLTTAPNGLFNMYETVFEQDALFGVYGNKLYIATGAGLLQERACGVSLTSSLHEGIQGRYGGRLATYIVQNSRNDSDVTLTSHLTIMKDTVGSTNDNWTQVSMAPQCACWFQNRFWVGFSAYGGQSYETLWWSELGDGGAYSANNTLQIEPGIGGHIVHLLPMRGFNPLIVVFKQTAIATIEPTWGSSSSLVPQAADALDTIKTKIRLISPKTGCEAPLSVQFIPGAPGGDIYFLAKDGVRALTRANDDTISGVSKPLSHPIRDTIKRINFKYSHKIISEVYDNKYFLAVPLDGATENTHILVFDMQNPGWLVETWTPKAMVATRMTDEVDRLWMQYNTITYDCSITGGESSYHMYKTYSGQAEPGGAPVIFQEQTRAISFGDITQKKKWDMMSLTFRNDSADTCVMGLMYNVDHRGWVTAGSAVFGAVPGGSVTMGETPLPWGVNTTAARVYKLSLTDAPPGYFIQLKYFGTSDLSIPVVLETAVYARPVHREMDNEIT